MRRALILICVAAGPAAAASRALPGHAGMYVAPAGPAAAADVALPMVDSHLDVAVRGAIVEVVVHQRFHNDADHVTEATYIFPLPEDAAVTAMAITTGSRTIHAAIAPRADAQRRYEDAVTAGVSAALLEEERPDVFTQTVAAIPARGDVEITLRYDALARPRGDGTWQLAVPLVVAPRYVPGTASGRPTTGAGHAPDTDRAPDASRVTPGGKPDGGGPTAIELSFADPVDDVTSPTHELVARGHGYALTDARSDHDAWIRWRDRHAETGWVESDEEGGTAAVVVRAPPAGPRPAGASALELGLVLDRSALAHGDADVTERPFVRELLGGLTPADAVTVTGSAVVARGAPADAWRELDRAWAPSPGAFDLTRALRGAHGAAIVLVTPGLVADDAAALAAARALRAPVHVVGVGAAPNRALLTEIARATGGTVRFAAADEDLAALARDVLADLASPPAPLAITWGTLAASDVVPQTMPRLGAGQARLVLARVQRAQPANGRARGDVFAIALTPTAPPLPGAVTARGPLARRWARERLGELLASGRDVAAATALALRYGLVSPTTSMIAVGDEVVIRGGVKHTAPVPVAIPAGMRWQPLERELRVATHDDAAPPKEERPAPETKPAPKQKPTDTRDARKEGSHTAAPPRRPTATAPAAPSPEPAPPPPPAPVAHGEKQKVPADPSPTGASLAQGAAAGADGDGVADRADDAEASRELGRARAPVAVSEVESATPGDDVVILSDGRARRASRLSLAIGGGLTLTDPRDGLLTVSLRVAPWRLPGMWSGASTRLGGEAALWLVGGAHGQGRLLGTLTMRAGRVELGVGVGAHLADPAGLAIGPALGASVGVDVWGALSAVLRYDGALLFGDAGHADEHAVTAGAQWRW